MDATFSWEVIDTPERFQELIGSALLEEVSKHVDISTKPGKDYGIDASYDGAYDGKTGRWRFQVKRYADLDNLLGTLHSYPSKPGEVARIIGHLNEATTKIGRRLWDGTTHYRLITNLRLLPQEKIQVRDELAPLKAHGIDVDVWDGAWVEATCGRSQLVMQQYFGDDPPMLVSRAEFRRQQLVRPFGSLYHELPYLGRSDLLASFQAFLAAQDAMAFLVVGTGGVGKTRGLLELTAVCDEDPTLDVRFVQTQATMFQRHPAKIEAGKHYVVVVDDAEQFAHLRPLLGLATRHPQWGGRLRLVIACRGSVVAPVRALLHAEVGPGRLRELELPPARDAMPAIATHLGVTDGAETLIRLADGVPLWLVLAVDAVRRGVSLPSLTRETIIRSYLDRYLNEVAPPERPLHLRFLQVLAALEPVNVRSSDVRQMFADALSMTVPDAMRIYEDVRRAGFVSLFGRYMSISPDIAADHILLRAMFTEPDQLPTDLHHTLLAQRVPDVQHLVSNLARAEYLAGKPLLDEIVDDLIRRVADMDNFARRAVLTNFAAIAYVRANQFVHLVELMMASPHARSQRDVLGHPDELTHGDVRDQIPPLLRPAFDWPDVRPRALTLLSEIARAQDFADSAGFGAVRIFEEEAQYEEEGDLSRQSDVLALLEEWRRAGRGEMVPLFLAGLRRILAFEVRFFRPNGWNAIYGRGRVQVSIGLKATRARAVALLAQLLADTDAAVRRTAVKALDEAIREANLASEGETPTTSVVAGGPDGMTPEKRTGVLPGTGDDAYVRQQLDELFALVEQRAAVEEGPDALARLDGTVRWHADHAAQTPLGKRALAIRSALRERPAFRLLEVVHSLNHDPTDDSTRDALVRELGKHSDATAFVAAFGAAVADSTHLRGGGAALLQELGKQYPTFARDVLDLLVDPVRRSDPASHPFYVSRLLVGLHVAGHDRSLIGSFARRGGWHRQVAVQAACRLRPEWHSGFTLSASDIALFRDLARDPETSVWGQMAQFVWLLADSAPAVALDLADDLVAHPGDGWAQGVAQVCEHLLRRGPEHRDRIDKLLDAFFLLPHLAEPHIEAALSRRASENLPWLIDFFESRVRRVVAEGTSVLRFEPVPDGFERVLPQSVQARDDFEAAIQRVLHWTVNGGALERDSAATLLKGLVGVRVTPVFVNALRAHLGAGPEPQRPLGAASTLHVFRDDALKFMLMGECLLVLEHGTPSDQIALLAIMADVFWRGGVSARAGEVPPLYLERGTLLGQMRQYFQTSALVGRFIHEADDDLRREITSWQEHDRERHPAARPR